MKSLKKISAVVLALVLMFTFAACTLTPSVEETTVNNETTKAAENTEYKGEKIKVAAIKGPTGMGMAPLLEASEKQSTKLNYEFTIANAADEFTGNILNGNFEIACVPTNLASVLYAKTKGAVQVAAINTLGVLYVLENGDSIKSVEDLNGKTIYSAGQGAVLLRYPR